MARSKEKSAQKQPRQFRRVWWIPVLRGLLYIVLGVLLLIPPLQDISTTPWLFGIFLAVDGVVLILQWFSHRRQLGAQWWLVQAVVNVAFGAAILLWGQFWDITAVGQYWLLVVWVLVLGIASIVGAMYLSRNRDLGSSWMAVFGIVSALFGITLITQDLGDLQVVSFTCVVLGLFAFVSGAILMVSGFATRAVAREIDNLRKQAENLGIELTGGFVLGASGAVSTVSQAELRPEVDAVVVEEDEPVAVVDDRPDTRPVGIDAREASTQAPATLPEGELSGDPSATGEDPSATGQEPASTRPDPDSARIHRHDDEHSTLEDPPEEPRRDV
ncbi:HdeD family acid-resistance protein [Paraoerskovia marina]|uniref:HdeD family acid-resistance protein n=1 Tax=Paraoerskovia marina TaxID=545619 RepID=UPI0009DD5A5A|nr:DUF308 domain-containing protein [Paraoerskovia marina]